MKITKISVLSAGVLMSAVSLGVHAEPLPEPVELYNSLGTDVSSNLAVGSSSTTNSTSEAAGGFVVTGESYVLNDLALDLRQRTGDNATAGDFEITLYSSATNGLPGTALESWTIGAAAITATQSQEQPVMLMSVDQPGLSLGQTYWVGVAALEPGASVLWAQTEEQTGPNATLFTAGSANVNWFSSSSSRAKKFRVTGVVPEPATAILLGGLGAIGLRRRGRR